MLFPKTYLSDPERIDQIMDSLNLEKHPELYEKIINIDVILSIRPEVLDYFIKEWHIKGPETPVANLMKNAGKYVIEGSISLFKSVISAAGSQIVQIFKTSNPTSDSDLEDNSELNVEEAKIAEEQIRQQKIVYEYLNHLYEYLKSSNYFDSAPEVDNTYGTTSKYTITIYFFNMIMLFRSRWRYGLRNDGFQLLDGGIETSQNTSVYNIGDKVCSTISVIGMSGIRVTDNQLSFEEFVERDENNITATIVDKYPVNVYSLSNNTGWTGSDNWVIINNRDIDEVFKLSYTIPLKYTFNGQEFIQNFTVHKNDVKTTVSRGSAVSTMTHGGDRYRYYGGVESLGTNNAIDMIDRLYEERTGKTGVIGTDESFFTNIVIKHYDEETNKYDIIFCKR